MKLLKNGVVVDHDWVFCASSNAADCNSKQIVPFEAFLASSENDKEIQGDDGIQINANVKLDDVAPHLDRLALIVIDFGAFADGRGFSIAHRLRHSLGYRGQIWGSGNLIADQYALAVRCGIDGVLVDEQLLERQPVQHWQEALADAPAPYVYQDGMKRDQLVSGPASTHVGDETIAKLNDRFKGAATEELLEFVLHEECLGRTAVVSSFGAQSAVLLHLVAKTAPQTPILFVDTGKLFPETLVYQRKLTTSLNLAVVEILRPNAVEIEDRDPQGGLWENDNVACCSLRKVGPLNNALVGYDTWISGRKSYQSELRSPLQLFERSGSHIKVNPLAGWSHNQLAEYMQHHDLPAHPLVSKGYASIGCAHCTTPVCEGERIRAGRWRGLNKTECGIHFNNGKAVRQQLQSI